MTSYEFGEVVLVPFPFTDQTTSKKRPAVIISSRNYNRRNLDLILMAVTSQISPALSVDEMLIGAWQQAGLLKPSVIKPVITTLEKGLVLRRLGKLQVNDLAALQSLLVEILG